MKQNFILGMPHLNYNGIDPIWLVKTLGDSHWNLLKEIKSINAGSERLYASFFTIQLLFSENQASFKEQDQIDISSKILKFNSSVYRSEHLITNSFTECNVIMDTIFVKKNSDGLLVRDEPLTEIEVEHTEEISLTEHRNMKRDNLNFDQDHFNLLSFSPETYFNGVKILYCANYFNLIFLNEYITFQKIPSPIKKIKMFFFGNISPGDRVYGKSVEIDDHIKTILVSNDKLIGTCLTWR